MAVAPRAALGVHLNGHGVIEEATEVVLSGEVVLHVEVLGQHPTVIEQTVLQQVVVDLTVGGRVPHRRCDGIHTGVAGSLGVVAQSVVEHMYQLSGRLFDGERLQELRVGVDAPLFVDADSGGRGGGDDWA